jgi:DNA sulfur modification protein DndE
MKRIVYLLAAIILVGFMTPEKKVVFFMIGDSTMADKPLSNNPERGWGQLFPQYISDAVDIKNLAVNGRSTKSFIKEGKWDTVMKYMKEGDYVFIQFGHNDSKLDDSIRSAPANTIYKQNLIRFVNDTRKKGGNPILLTPVMRRKFNASGIFVDQHGDYPGVVRFLADSMRVPLIDLHASSKKLIENEGVEGSKKMFLWIDSNHFKLMPVGKKDDTHFSEYGAAQIASLVCAEILEKHPALSKYLLRSAHKEKYAFELPKIYEPHFKKDTFSVVAFGAVKDGITLNTVAINTAIVAANKVGGGIVHIPAGLWLTGPIVLLDNVELNTAKGALVLFTKDRTQYPLKAASFEGVEAARCQSPISATNAVNIAITGQGIFNGGGEAWRPLKKGKVTESEWKRLINTGGVLSEDKTNWYPSAGALQGSLTNNIGKLVGGATLSSFEPIRDFLRPNMIRLTNCSNVLLEGITFENSPAWTMHILMSKHITIRKVNVKNPWYGQNTDALDLESCTNALIDGCNFDTGDDGICIKSGRDEEGRKRGMPTKDIIAINTTVYHAHGGFVIGSEMSGGANNIFVSNCTFIGTDIGLRFKTTRGRGGIVENIYASNITMRDIVGEAILFDMYYAAKDPVPLEGEKKDMPVIQTLPVTEATPIFRNFYFNNVYCNGAEKAVFVRGIPEMNISNLVLSDMVFATKKGIEITEGSNIEFNNIKLVTQQASPLVYIQNSSKLTFNNFSIEPNIPLVFSINGDRAHSIHVKGLNWNNAIKKDEFLFGAKTNSISYQQ